MAGLLATIQDSINPHVRFVISVPEGGTADGVEQQVRQILKHAKATTWGWKVTDETVAFSVYKPHRYTARGFLEEAGVEFGR